MTKDDIIRMAHEADREWDCDRDMYEWLETFAQSIQDHYSFTHAQLWLKRIKDAVSAEREEIAQFIEKTELGSLPEETALHYARLLKAYSTAIRERGKP